MGCLKQDLLDFMNFRDGGGLAGTGALVRVFTRDHESFTRDWVRCLKQDFRDGGGLAGTGALV